MDHFTITNFGAFAPHASKIHTHSSPLSGEAPQSMIGSKNGIQIIINVNSYAGGILFNRGAYPCDHGGG